MCCIWEQSSFCLFLVRCRRMDRPAALCARRRRRRAAIGCCLHVGVSWLARGKPSAFIQYRNKKISSQNDAAWIVWPAASVSSFDYFLLPSSFDLALPEKTSINSQCSFYHWFRKQLSGDDDGPERTSGFSYFLRCTSSHSVKPVYLDHNKLQSQPTNIPGNKMNYKSWTSSILCSHKDSLSRFFG